MLKGLDKNIRLRALTLFLTQLISFSVVPNMTVYYNQHFGTFWTGLLLFITSAGTLVGALYGGHTSDVLGRKKTINLGQIGMAIGALIAVTANIPGHVNPLMTFFGIFVTGIFSANVMPAEQAMMIDLTDDENRRMVFAVMYWVSNLGMLIGASLGAWFFRDYLFELLLMMVGLILINFMIVYFGMHETYVNANKQIASASVKTLLTGYYSVLKDKRYALLIVSAVLFAVTPASLDFYLPVHLTESFQVIEIFGQEIYGQRMFSIVGIINTIIVITLTAVITKAVKRMQLFNVFATGLLLEGAGIATSFILNNFWPIVFTTLVFSIGEIIESPAQETIQASMMDPNRIGAYSGLNSITFPISFLIASLLVSASSFTSNVVIAIVVFIMVLISMILAYVAYKMPETNRSEGD
ncbi:MFS transporter [Weissella minor]|uniref:MFS transporter n=1 Tax=Weissella minor TaxID=1620 RepID=UPI001BAE92D3|nr:MFS transporter [Weissella minor]MBS0950111.1 MFS transporter [Weissella minor]